MIIMMMMYGENGDGDDDYHVFFECLTRSRTFESVLYQVLQCY